MILPPPLQADLAGFMMALGVGGGVDARAPRLIAFMSLVEERWVSGHEVDSWRVLVIFAERHAVDPNDVYADIRKNAERWRSRRRAIEDMNARGFQRRDTSQQIAQAKALRQAGMKTRRFDATARRDKK